MNTYLGNKGYTIPKSELKREELEDLRNNLVAKPLANNCGIQNKQHTFPIYRESLHKIYIPRYYGIKKFKNPKQNKISEGNDITCVFQGSLRPIQQPVVDTFMKHVLSGNGGGLLELPCAFGKTVLSLYIISLNQKRRCIPS
jgi:hypothetical protein